MQIMEISRILVIVLLSAGWLSACRDRDKLPPTTPQPIHRQYSGQVKPVSVSELRAHQASWAKNGYARYQFHFEVQISFTRIGPMIVHVDGGKVVKVRDLSADPRWARDGGIEIPTVERLFQAMITSVEKKELPVRAEFHPILHFPTEVHSGYPEMDAGTVYFLWNMRLP